MILLPVLLFGGSAGCLGYWYLSRRKASTGLEYVRGMGRQALSALRVLHPPSAQRAEEAADRLALHADRPSGIGGIEVVGLTVLAAIAAAIFLGLYGAAVMPQYLGYALLVGVPLAACLPAHILTSIRNRRRRRIQIALPMVSMSSSDSS